MKKVCWLTGSSFIDVDISLIPDMSQRVDLFWIVLLQKESFYSEQFILDFMKQHDISGKVVVFKNRLRSFEVFKQYKATVKLMTTLKSDVYYIDYLGLPYLFPLIYLSRISNKKIIYPCHDFIDHLSIPNRKQIIGYKKFIFKNFKNFQFFSKTQKDLFEKKYKNKKTSFIPLNLKSFGEPNSELKNDKIYFLFFGTIRRNKGLEILIKAINLLSDEYKKQICVRVYGNCNDWAFYEDLIMDKSVYDLAIRRIENDEVPNLFASSHFLVLPYHDVTQSGPLLISYNYKVPVVASDLSGFREYIDDEKTGYLFECDNPQSLAITLKKIVKSKESYSKIKRDLEYFISQNITQEILLQKYEEMFNRV